MVTLKNHKIAVKSITYLFAIRSTLPREREYILLGQNELQWVILYEAHYKTQSLWYFSTTAYKKQTEIYLPKEKFSTLKYVRITNELT